MPWSINVKATDGTWKLIATESTWQDALTAVKLLLDSKKTPVRIVANEQTREFVIRTHEELKALHTNMVG